MALGRAAIVGTLLGGPMVLAFFSGGYFERPRLWALAIAWLLVALAAVVCRRPWPRSAPAWLAVGGLAGLTAWTALSIDWSPVRDVAQGDAERLGLYLGVVVAGAAALRTARPSCHRAGAAPVALVVVPRGCPSGAAGRLHAVPSRAAQARLEQPLTYWNAMGLLAGLGDDPRRRVAGDATRARASPVAAAAIRRRWRSASYLPLSRGAALAVALGLSLVAVLEPTRAQLRAMVVLGLTSAPAVLAAALLPEVRALDGGSGTREVQGRVALGLLVATGVIGGDRVARTASSGPRQTDPCGAGRTVARVGLATTAVGAVALFTLTALQRHGVVVNPSGGAINGRLTSLESNRGDFWRVARTTFPRTPSPASAAAAFRPPGSSGAPSPTPRATRTRSTSKRPPSSGSSGWRCSRVPRRLGALRPPGVASESRTARAGLSAVVLVWAVHAGLDWDWEMPGRPRRQSRRSHTSSPTLPTRGIGAAP